MLAGLLEMFGEVYDSTALNKLGLGSLFNYISHKLAHDEKLGGSS